MGDDGYIGSRLKCIYEKKKLLGPKKEKILKDTILHKKKDYYRVRLKF